MRLLLLISLAALLSACDQNDAQRQSEEQRLAELRDLEQRAVQREADANAAEMALERKRLADEQAGLDLERQKLAREKAAIQEDATKLAQWRAEEQRLQQRQTVLQNQQERSAQAEREASAARERAREAGRQAQQESSVRHLDYFHAPLDPLGDWIEVAPYGHCWQPREARTASWRPYMDGTWVFTDYGWTWKANEPFGWATYHYGRWARIKRIGWVWVPGSEWAPAWVAWRRSDQYVGWAPLPPEAHSGTGFNAGVDSYYDIGPASYNFVPAASFGEPTYRGIVVEPERNVTIVNQTVNVTKVRYTTVENKTVVFNGGPELVQINASSNRPVQRLTLERMSERPADSGRPAIVGNVLKLLAPRITSASKPIAAPSRVKEVVKAGEVERGWSGGDAPAVQAIRAQIRQEAGKAEEQTRAAAAVAPAPPDSQDAARGAEAARMAAEKKAEAERASVKQAEALKKATTDREMAAKQQADLQRADEQRAAEKQAAAMKAQADAAAATAAAAGEAARMAAEKKAEAEGANAKQVEAQKKAMADRETAAKQQAELKRADEQRAAEKKAADMKAQVDAAAAAQMATQKKAEAEAANAQQVEAQKKVMADRDAAAVKKEEMKRAGDEQRKAEKHAADLKAQAESSAAAAALRAKEAPAPMPVPALPPATPGAAPNPALPPVKAPETVAPVAPDPSEIEKKGRGAERKGGDQKGKADREEIVKPKDETKPAPIDPPQVEDVKGNAKQKAKADKKRAEEEAGKADSAK